MPTSDHEFFEVWDVVKVPFPYTARPIQQHRPALVVAGGLPLGSPFVLWVLMITSAANRPWGGDTRISDIAAAGLSAPSVVRTDKIATIEIADAQRIGRLATHDRDDVRQKLGWFFQRLL
ncbi:type II toxin-antitoxin system PemK/MazF family toxin [Acidisoma sp. 7E03]